MKVKVLFFASIRDVTGVRELVLDVDEFSTVLDVLNLLVKRFGMNFKEHVFERDFLPKPHVRLALNDDYLDWSKIGFLKVRDGDVIAFLPPVSGG